jgi:hypothetical protein
MVVDTGCTLSVVDLSWLLRDRHAEQVHPYPTCDLSGEREGHRGHLKPHYTASLHGVAEGRGPALLLPMLLRQILTHWGVYLRWCCCCCCGGLRSSSSSDAAPWPKGRSAPASDSIVAGCHQEIDLPTVVAVAAAAAKALQQPWWTGHIQCARYMYDQSTKAAAAPKQQHTQCRQPCCKCPNFAYAHVPQSAKQLSFTIARP